MTSYWGQGALLTLIHLYRRHISGRGPLQKVSCTFHQCESCSAYGLRVAQTGTGLIEVLRLIRGRLRRCGEASLFRAGETLLWGELYQEQDPKRFEETLLNAKESPAVIGAALLHAARVAKFQRDEGRSRSLARRSMQYPKAGELTVRRGDALLSALTSRLRLFLCWPGVLLLLSAMLSLCFLSLWWILPISAGFSLLWSAQIFAKYWRKRAHFQSQLISLAFLTPNPSPCADERVN